MTESPGGATVRSVRVKLDLEIASYVAKSKTVGRESEAMAQRVDRSFNIVNRRLVDMEKGLDGVTVSEKRVEGAATSMNNRLRETERQLGRNESVLKRNNSQLDSFSGRTKLIAQGLAVLGPGLTTLGAAGVPVLSALAVGGTAAALGIGATVAAFSGIGDALKALDAYQADQTAENLAKVREEFERIGPAGADFVRFLDSIEGDLKGLQNITREGILPGAEDSIRSLLTLLPELRSLTADVSNTVGDLLGDAGDSLAGDDFEGFIDYLRTDAAPTLDSFARTTGNFVQAFANLLVGLSPATRDATDGLLEFSEDVVRASENLDDNEGFQNALEYIRENGPAAAEFLGAVGGAAAGLVEATAPYGAVVIPALTAVANLFEFVAKSPVGPTILTTVAALALLNRGMATFDAISKRPFIAAMAGADGLTAKLNASRGSLAKGALAFGGLTLAASGAADKIGLGNTATLALTGSLAGPWGAAAGAAIGLFMDMNKGVDGFQIRSADLLSTLEQQTGAVTENTEAFVARQLVEQGVLDHARDLGVDLTLVTQAALGNKDAIAAVTGELEALDAALFDSNGYEKNRENTNMVRDGAAAIQDAIGATNGEIADARHNLPLLNSALGETGTEAEDAADKISQMEGALNRLNGVLDRRQAMRDYKDAIADFNATLKDPEASPRELQAALDGIARNAGRVIETLSGADKKRFFQQAKRDAYEAAVELLGSERAAQKFVDKLFDLGRTNTKPKIDVDTDKAFTGMRAVEQGLRNINDETVYVNIVRRGDPVAASTGRGPLDNPPKADGGTITGPRTPYRDKVLTYLAPGEEVISNRHGQADRARPLLKRINANRFADGGTVSERIASTYVRTARGGKGLDSVAGLAYAADDAARGLKGLEKQLTRAEKAVDRETSRRDRFQSRYDSITSGTASSLMSDLFASQGSVWGTGGGSDPLGVLQGDIANIDAFDALRKRLERRGLDDGALEAAAAGGVAGLQQIAGYTDAQLAAYERLYNERARKAQAAGTGLAQTLVGDKLDASNERLDTLIDRVEDLEDAVKAEGKKGRDNATQNTKGFASALNDQTGQSVTRGS